MGGHGGAFFSCSTCESLYHVIKERVGSERVRRCIPCCVCGTALTGHDGTFIFKYFIVRRTDRPRKKKQRAIRRSRVGG